MAFTYLRTNKGLLLVSLQNPRTYGKTLFITTVSILYTCPLIFTIPNSFSVFQFQTSLFSLSNLNFIPSFKLQNWPFPIPVQAFIFKSIGCLPLMSHFLSLIIAAFG